MTEIAKSFSPVSFAGGIVIGALLASAWFLGGGSAFTLVPAPFPAPSAGLATSTLPGTPSSGAVAVASQPAGSSVVVESVTVPPPGVWVAVRDVNGGDLGNVLGAALVGGPRTDVAVPLLRATEPGRRYAVELYRDDGNGAFDLSADSVYVDFDTGERVVAYFSTTE